MRWEEDHETDKGAKKKTKRRLDEGGRRSWDGHGCEEEEDREDWMKRKEDDGTDHKRGEHG